MGAVSLEVTSIVLYILGAHDSFLASLRGCLEGLLLIKCHPMPKVPHFNSVNEASKPSDKRVYHKSALLQLTRRYFDHRRFQRSLLNYDVLALDSRAFDNTSDLKFHYAYWPAKTLSTEVFRSPYAVRGEPNYVLCLFSAVAEFHRFLETQDATSLDRFVEQARTVLSGTTTVEGCRAIPRFDRIKCYGDHRVPWISCHSQGWALSVFCRAYQVTRKEQFLDAAHSILRSFNIDVPAGGIRDREKTGRLFFEEYPFPGKVRHVLNGFIAALLGIHEFGRATGERLARDLFDEGIATLCDEVLETFDAGHTTRYDQMTERPEPASYLYTKVHARQLAILHRLTGKPHFLGRAQLWQRYTINPTDRFLLGIDCFAYRLANAPRYAREMCNRWKFGSKAE
jgi:hypothetical protein